MVRVYFQLGTNETVEKIDYPELYAYVITEEGYLNLYKQVGTKSLASDLMATFKPEVWRSVERDDPEEIEKEDE